MKILKSMRGNNSIKQDNTAQIVLNFNGNKNLLSI